MTRANGGGRISVENWPMPRHRLRPGEWRKSAIGVTSPSWAVGRAVVMSSKNGAKMNLIEDGVRSWAGEPRHDIQKSCLKTDLSGCRGNRLRWACDSCRMAGAGVGGVGTFFLTELEDRSAHAWLIRRRHKKNPSFPPPRRLLANRVWGDQSVHQAAAGSQGKPAPTRSAWAVMKAPTQELIWRTSSVAARSAEGGAANRRGSL